MSDQFNGNNQQQRFSVNTSMVSIQSQKKMAEIAIQ